ncbi:hypothetical protein [Candidatus Nitrosotenuis uzonensis]|uniref:Uncharacterized protein n=1 Tax=Candidatus Nitrosotenuis uzonensis TaxID=1407055 RepID=V6ATA1_9ARCH|nr:hypothetical protein [Candidatus Nitrosotenuis uzonensis]CDI05814.1 conserved hypothetical protein [Candidatus Nitrosotenuis uzonensis]
MDEYKQRVRKLKLMSDSLRRRTSIYSQISDIDKKDSARSLKALRKAPDPGGKMQKIGFIIFWVPEPTGISNAIGAPMILAGKYLQKKYNGATLKDIASETKNHNYTVTSFKDAMF